MTIDYDKIMSLKSNDVNTHILIMIQCSMH